MAAKVRNFKRAYLAGMTALALHTQHYTPAEYIALLDESDEKYEYFDGQVYAWQAMAGTTDEHSAICDNLHGELRTALIAAGKPCKALNSDALLHIPSLRSYRFPDVTVQCGDPIYDEETGRARTNPTVLIEVISESSRTADYTKKLKQYGELASLRDYVVVEQDFPMVTVFSRDSPEAPRWSTIIYFVKGAQIDLPSLDLAISIEELYRDLVFEGKKSRLSPGAGVPAWPSDKPVV